MNNLNTKGKAFEEYRVRIEKYKDDTDKLSKRINFISMLRGVVFAAGAALTYYFYRGARVELSFYSAIAAIVVFIFLIAMHEKLKQAKRYSSLMEKINEDSIKRESGQWKSFEDTGDEFVDYSHPYTFDLDIFGKGSLFQWINTTNTYLGRDSLRENLSNPLKNIELIKKKQEATRELSSKIDFRQRLQSEGMLNENKSMNPEKLFKWAVDKRDFFLKHSVILLARIIPAITIVFIIYAAASPTIRFTLPLSMIFVQVILLFLNSKRTAEVYGVIDKYVDDIRAFEKMIKIVEEEKFSSEYLVNLQGELKNQKNQSAWKQIKELKRVVEMMALRRGEMYFVINIVLLWDYQCHIALEGWKEESGSSLKRWFNVLGEFEALSSLSVIGCDNPEFVYPNFTEDSIGLQAKKLGHPLLGKERVSNDLELRGEGNILLITGSNMSGKSTLLRTAGINLVLAYAGAAVCAEEFNTSILNIYTSMRISDNLENNISSFYAELLRIKMVLEAAKSGERVFFLLDEIFRGTNSRDRHTGAKVLIRKLSSLGAVGLVSTHDLELGDLAEGDSKIRNYHFREEYREGKIFFDYMLRMGVSPTRNAIYLMRMAGIDIEDNE